MRLKKRKVTEIKQKLHSAFSKRIFVANHMKNTDVEIDCAERVDGVKPRVIIRIKNMTKRLKRKKK